MVTPIATLGSITSHGGVVITAATKTMANQKLVARIGDLAFCPIHGVHPIIALPSPGLFVEGPLCAKVGSITTCGAVIVSSLAPKTLVG